MNIRKWNKFALLFAVFILPLIGFQHLAFCHGGGGGSDGEERDQFSNLASYQGAATTLLSELSYDEIKGLMHGLNADVRSMLLDDYLTWPPGTTVKQLIGLIDTGVPVSRLNEKERDSLLANLDDEIRNYLLNDWDQWTGDLDVADLKNAVKKWQAMPAAWAQAQDNMTKGVEFVDWAGQKAETVLAFTPVGLFWAVLIATTRAGAESRKKGNGSYDILKDAVLEGGFSYVTNSLSKADNILDLATTGAKDKVKQLMVYLSVKYAEGEAGNAVKDTASEVTTTVTNKKNQEIAATFVSNLMYGMPTRENKATTPTYSSSTGYGPGQTHQMQHTAQ
ncbi:MAG: hypothetical protein JRJ68_11460 [Deltaproteobacteria bacterium]|nr:hypothetical protein [Deltaproteobacteria bacterium]